MSSREKKKKKVNSKSYELNSGWLSVINQKTFLSQLIKEEPSSHKRYHAMQRSTATVTQWVLDGTGISCAWRMKDFSVLDDVMEEILGGLAVKSLIRFRCISKSWYSICPSSLTNLNYQTLESQPSQIINIHYQSQWLSVTWPQALESRRSLI